MGKRVLFDDQGAVQVVPGQLHDGRPVYVAVDDRGDTLQAPWQDVLEQVELRDGVVAFCAKGPSVAAEVAEVAQADPAEVVALQAQVADLQARIQRAAVAVQGWRREVQQARGEVAAAKAESTVAGAVLARLPAGSALVAESTVGEVPVIIEVLRGVPGLSWAGLVWLGGALVPVTDWWTAGWHLALTVGLGIVAANLMAAYLRACGSPRGRWVPVVLDGKYVSRVDRFGCVEVYADRQGEKAWRTAGEFLALPPAPPAPPAGE